MPSWPGSDEGKGDDGVYSVMFRYRDGRSHVAEMTREEFDRYMKGVDKAARKRVLARSKPCPECGEPMCCGQQVHWMCSGFGQIVESKREAKKRRDNQRAEGMF